MKSYIRKVSMGLVLMLIVVLGYMGYRYEQLEQQRGFVSTIGVSVPIGELSVLNKDSMYSLYREMDVKSPSEIIRKALVEYLYIKRNSGNIEQALYELDIAIGGYEVEEAGLVELGRAVRVAHLLREAGLVKQARNVLQVVVEGDVTNYAQGLDMVALRLKQMPSETFKIDERNTEAVLALVVLDNVLVGNDDEVKALVHRAFKVADWKLYISSGDYAQLYMWQLIGLYHPEAYSAYLKNHLQILYQEKALARETGSPRLLEAKLLGDQ